MLPSEVAKAYNFPEGRSLEQQCIAVVELGGGYSALDVFTYCDQHGYKHPELYNAFADGALETPDGPSGADGEVCLDLCVIAGVAQGVKILTVFAPNTDQGFCDAITLAANHALKPCAISISWGAPITEWDNSSRAAMDAAIQAALAKGIQVFVASGDNGSEDGTQAAVVDYPSSSPYSVGCGGTRLTLNPDGTRASEKAWTLEDGNGSTGGGNTLLYSKPDFQVGRTPLPGRCVPDIAGNADPVTGYDILTDMFPMAVGGTSAVAPLYAALCAIITSRLGRPVQNWREVLYSNAVTVDVVGGDNGDFQCTAGYDCCTGLGTVDGEKFLAALANANGLQVLDPVASNPKPTFPDIPQFPFWKSALLKIKQVLGLRRQGRFRKHLTRLKK